MDKCINCSYNTNDFVCHPHCGGCNGESKFEPKKDLTEFEDKIGTSDKLEALKTENETLKANQKYIIGLLNSMPISSKSVEKIRAKILDRLEE